MNKKMFLIILLLLQTTFAYAAQQPVTVGTEAEKADIDTNFANTHANFTELYAVDILKADKTELITSGSCVNNVVVLTRADASTITTAIPCDDEVGINIVDDDLVLSFAGATTSIPLASLGTGVTIDDTAGTGDTAVTWSADKSTEEIETVESLANTLDVEKQDALTFFEISDAVATFLSLSSKADILLWLDDIPADEGTLSFSPTSWDAADGTVGDTAATQTITVTATGGDYTFTSYALGGSNEYEDAETGTCTQTTVLAQDASCTINLSFPYSVAGVFSDTLTINGSGAQATLSLGPTTVSAASSGSEFLEDTFTETTNTALNSHTADTGGSWLGGASSLTVNANDDALAMTVDDETVAYNNVSPGTDDYTVTTVGKTGVSTWQHQFGSVARWNTSTGGYSCRVRGDGAVLIATIDTLADVNNLVESTISSFSETTEYTVEFTVTGTSLSCSVLDGVTSVGSINTTDSTYTSGYAGVMMRGISGNQRLTYVSAE